MPLDAAVVKPYNIIYSGTGIASRGHNMDTFVTIKEAAAIHGISDRTVRRRIETGELKAKREGRRVYVQVDTEAAEVDTEQQEELVDELRGQLAEKDKQISELHQLLMAAEGNVKTLAGQLEQSQRLLEYHKEPWYRRWFRR